MNNAKTNPAGIGAGRVLLAIGLIGLVIVLCAALTGCQGPSSSLEGMDYLELVNANTRKAVAEALADEKEHKANVNRRLADGLAIDLVKIASDPEKVRVKAREYVDLVALNDARFAQRMKRWANVLNATTAADQIIDMERQMMQVRMGWNTDAIQYSQKLRTLVMGESAVEPPVVTPMDQPAAGPVPLSDVDAVQAQAVESEVE